MVVGKVGGVGDVDVWLLEVYWFELVMGLVDQIIEGVSMLQQYIDNLLVNGCINKLEYCVLSVLVECIKLVGVSVQQINWFYGGCICQFYEKVDMLVLVEGVLQECKKELVILGVVF